MMVFDRNAWLLSGSITVTTLFLNPLIYASRYDAFRRGLRQMLNVVTVSATTSSGYTG